MELHLLLLDHFGNNHHWISLKVHFLLCFRKQMDAYVMQELSCMALTWCRRHCKACWKIILKDMEKPCLLLPSISCDIIFRNIHNYTKTKILLFSIGIFIRLFLSFLCIDHLFKTYFCCKNCLLSNLLVLQKLRPVG